MFCKYCGKQIPDGQVCSCQIPQQPQYQQAPEQPQYQQPQYQQPQYQQPQQQYYKEPRQSSFDANVILNDVKAWLKNTTTTLSWISMGVFGFTSYLLYSIFYLCMLGSIDEGVGIAFWYSLLTMIVGSAFFIGTLTVKDLIAKRNIDIKAHLSRYFGNTVLMGGILLTGGLAAFIDMNFAVLFIFAAVMIRIRDYVQILNGFFKDKTGLVATGIVVGVIAFILTISNIILIAGIDEYMGFVLNLGF